MRVENVTADQSILIALKRCICIYTHLIHLHCIAFDDLKSEAKWRKSFALGLVFHGMVRFLVMYSFTGHFFRIELVEAQ